MGRMSQANEGREVRWQVAPRSVAGVLLGIVLLLAAAHVIIKVLWGFVFPRYNLNYYHYIYGAHHFFDIARGSNLPAYFSTLNKLLAGGLAAILALSARQRGNAQQRNQAGQSDYRDWPYWAALSAGFLWLSLDEGAKVHDTMVSHGLNLLWGGTSLASYGWFVIYVPIIVVAAAAFVPFVSRLERAHRIWLLTGAFVFLGGGLGIEMVESYLHGQGPYSEPLVDIAVLIEETLEMVGVVIFNYAFLRCLADKEIGLHVRPTSV
jgi:hypothetical protein